ncbi:hypothetical protein JCM5296_007057 [Sporobolomyces johnsonii]
MAAPFELAYTPPLAAVPAWLSYTVSPTATVVAPYTVATFAENGNPTLQVAQATITQFGTNLIQLPLTVSLEAVESGEPQVDLGSLYTTAGGDGPTVGHVVGGTQIFTIGSQTRALAGSQPTTATEAQASQADGSSAAVVESSQATPTRQASTSQETTAATANSAASARTSAASANLSSLTAVEASLSSILSSASAAGESSVVASLSNALASASSAASVANALGSATLPSSSSASTASSSRITLPSSFVTSRSPSSTITSRGSSSALPDTSPDPSPHSLSSLTPSQLAAAIAAPIAFFFLLCLLFALCCCVHRRRRKRRLYAAAGTDPAHDDAWDWVQPRFLEGGWSSVFGGSRPGTSLSRRSGNSRSRPGGGATATGEQSPLAAGGAGLEEDGTGDEMEERPRRTPTALGYAAALPERAGSRISAGLRSISGGSSDGDGGGRYQPLAHHERPDASDLVLPDIEAVSPLTSGLLRTPSPTTWDPYSTSPVTSEFPVLAPSSSLSEYSTVSPAPPVQPARGRFGPLGVAAATQGLVELTSPGGWTGYGSPRTDGRAPSETTFDDAEQGETPQLGYLPRQPGLETPPATPKAQRTRYRSSSLSGLRYPEEDPGEESEEEIAEDGDVTLSSSRPGRGGGAGERSRLLVSEMGWLSGRMSALESEGSMSRYSQSDTGMLAVPVRDASRTSTASADTSMGHTRLPTHELFINTPRWTGTRQIHPSALPLSTTSPMYTASLPALPTSASHSDSHSDSMSSTSSRFRDASSASLSASPVYIPRTPDLANTAPDSPMVYTPNSRAQAQGHRKTMSTGSVLDRIAASFGGGMTGLGFGGLGGGTEGGWMARRARNREISAESAADPFAQQLPFTHPSFARSVPPLPLRRTASFRTSHNMQSPPPSVPLPSLPPLSRSRTTPTGLGEAVRLDLPEMDKRSVAALREGGERRREDRGRSMTAPDFGRPKSW